MKVQDRPALVPVTGKCWTKNVSTSVYFEQKEEKGLLHSYGSDTAPPG